MTDPVSHTPGPWQATKNAYGCQFVQRWVAGEAHDLICGGNNHDTLTKPNDRLIAAAPELLAALERLEAATRMLPRDMDDPDSAMAYAVRVIAKAKGTT